MPAPVMTHPDRWRLDQLLAWEEKRMALAEAALEALVAPEREEMTVADLLPQPKRRRRTG
ncbi:MAG: hypothetical protein ACRDPG_04935 [Nocardioidaceae bacterium]